MQAVQLFRKWHPHLIWMDRRMPVMDGIEATRSIRELPDGQDVKIIAVTASVLKEQQQEMLEAGMNGFVHKPYRFHEIYDALAEQLGVTYIHTPAIADTEEEPASLLSPTDFSALPASLREELLSALENLDTERIGILIRQIREHDPSLGRTLNRYAVNFDYPAIIRALTAERMK